MVYRFGDSQVPKTKPESAHQIDQHDGNIGVSYKFQENGITGGGKSCKHKLTFLQNINSSPLFYDEEEIRAIVSLLLRMTTDPIIGDVKSALGSAIVALLNAIPEASWGTEVRESCFFLRFRL